MIPVQFLEFRFSNEIELLPPPHHLNDRTPESIFSKIFPKFYYYDEDLLHLESTTSIEF